MGSELKFFPKEDKNMKNPLILLSQYKQYHDSWCPGDTMSQGISNHCY